MKHIFLLSVIAALCAAPAFAQDVPVSTERQAAEQTNDDPLASGLPDFLTEQLGSDRAAPPRRSLQRALIPAGLLYASFDRDGDYAASRAELEAGITRSFAAADSNSNGTLSLVELANWREMILGSRDVLPGNTQFDKNFDSQISLAEFTITLTGLFESFDRNENGQLEFNEMTQEAPQARRPESQQRERTPLARQPGQRR